MVEIRCPNQRKIGDKWYPCNSLCAKLSRVAQVQLVCRKCKIIYGAVTNTDGEITYFSL